MSRYNLRFMRLDPQTLRREMEKIGADPEGVQIMVPKGRFFTLVAEGVKYAAASILKQEMLAKGGDAAVSGVIYKGGEYTSNMLLMGTERTLRRVANVLAVQPLPSLRELSVELKAALRNADGPSHPSLTIGSSEFRWGERTYVMGIVNVTPDSFSGDGLMRGGAGGGEPPPAEGLVGRTVECALALVEQGADIIDVGGESTRPGGAPVDAATELARVVPVIRRLRQATNTPISIDTYKAEVARAALDEGADLVNDVWGLRMDANLAPLVAERGVPVVLMHNRSKPRDAAQKALLGGRYVGVQYDDLMADVLRELRALVEAAERAGIHRERILIDPGIGFGKTVEQNLALLNQLDELRVLGLPILLGTSRKSFIGYTLSSPPEERLEGTAATVCVGIMRGAHIVRVHDVGPIVRAVRMTDAVVRGG